jgi:hypothetical protein
MPFVYAPGNLSIACAAFLNNLMGSDHQHLPSVIASNKTELSQHSAIKYEIDEAKAASGHKPVSARRMPKPYYTNARLC